MIKLVLAFVVVFVLFFFGIKTVREMTGKEQWQLTKYLGYSIVCTVLTIAALIALVVLF